jgi:hypothetical protein
MCPAIVTDAPGPGEGAMRQSRGPAEEPAPELIWVGDGAWVAQDPAMPADDPRRVVAYVEHKDHRVYVLWVRDRRDVCVYESLREAITAVAAACAAARAPQHPA